MPVDFLPVFMRLSDARCTVIGGGAVAARKVDTLIKAGSHVTVVCPELGAGLIARKDRNEIDHLAREYDRSLLDGIRLVIAATDDAALNARVSRDARDLNVPVNVVDQPTLCTFIMPSIVDRSPVVVAVSSGGAAPVLARLLRARLETMIPASYGRLATLMRDFRAEVKARIPNQRSRRRFWEGIVQGSVAERIFEGQQQVALNELRRALETDPPAGASGEVYLVGAGPVTPTC